MQTQPTINRHGTMSQRDVAELIGVSHRRIQQIEQRALKKMRAELQRQAEAEGVSVRDWINGV
jgi:DNA-directed RNA polymerase sigma subunit (sigma70/sigma32)